MTAIQITGALTMLSTNGDGPQLLTEAAEFLNALAQMGVQMAVEINLRPVGVPAGLSQSANFPPVLPQQPVDLVLRAPAPVDPTPAAPAQPEEPRPLLLLPWCKLDKEQRHALLHMEGRRLAKALRHPPTMAEWDTYKPAEYPTASALPKTFGETWATLAWSWTRESV